MSGDKKFSSLRPDGYVQVTDPDGRGFEAETLQCRHCAVHWVIKPGSGTRRGWCYNCQGPLCGAEVCFTCQPFEKWMEVIEAQQRRADLSGGVLID